ncbi:unnamed protein product [Closterium sp. Naga37s-1]|nr:unnamed protein product [Closterium sp. Naga37s-1]
MRADLCSHAEGTLIPELQHQGLRIPLQPFPIIDDNGYMCVDPPVDIRRELLDHKEKFAVMEHDIQVFMAKIEYLAIRKGVTSDELDAGALQHLGAVGDTSGAMATPRKNAKTEYTADQGGQLDIAQTPQTRTIASVAAISPCPAPRTPAQRDGLLPAMNTTPALVSQQERGHLALALRSRDKTPVQAAPGNSGRAASSGRTGVMWNAAKQRCKGRVSRAINDVEEVEAATQATEDQPMAEEPEDPPEDYTDDEASVDDDEVYEPGNDDMEEEDDWEEVNHDDKAA